jgi:threonine/homoserine/homoserine lactone efflux protein
MTPGLGAPFLLASLLVVMAPGPDLALLTQLVVTTGRRRPALAAAVGMITAGGVQAAVGVLGVGLVLAASPQLFTAVRVAGAVVLVWWAVAAWRRAFSATTPVLETVAAGRAFRRGFTCTVTNPKVGLFLVGFLPQFVPPDTARPALALAVLAAVHLGLGLTWLTTWTVVAARLQPVLSAGRVRRVVDALVGAVLLLFAIRLAVVG